MGFLHVIYIEEEHMKPPVSEPIQFMHDKCIREKSYSSTPMVFACGFGVIIKMDLLATVH